jgi:plasmid stabilization system protein ParE
MPKQIFWSPLSEGDFGGILEYLNENWDNNVAKNFIDLTESILKQIAANPRQFPVIYKKEKIRKCVLTKHNSLSYRDTKTQVEILRIYDTRQDPNNLTFKFNPNT